MINRSDDAEPERQSAEGEQIVWHDASRQYLPIWQARAWDKAKVNDRTYPSRPDTAELAAKEAHDRAMHLEGEDCSDCDCDEREDAGTLAMAKAVTARDATVEEPEPEEESGEVERKIAELAELALAKAAELDALFREIQALRAANAAAEAEEEQAAEAIAA